ncbi:MAG: flagellar motor protein MotB [Gracilibacteraceae bacterium]|jgi:chemotaxis protein MotB|nr:flagellar motor protein MotB [Gracilibacteraceae bacterium]
MAKKKQSEPEKDNAERWLLTYSDMITLLLALFIMLYAMSTIDAQKYAQIARSIAGAFEGGSGDLPDVGDGPAGESPSIDGEDPEQPAEFSDLYERLTSEVAANELSDLVDVLQKDDSIIVRFKDSVLFFADSPQMRPEGQVVLTKIGTILADMSVAIGHVRIEGHTADTGMENVSAFDLSAQRATTVLAFIVVEDRFPQAKASIAGYSHYVPIAENATEEGRARNRRVELLITPPPPEEVTWETILP